MKQSLICLLLLLGANSISVAPKKKAFITIDLKEKSYESQAMKELHE
jgi:hypothetical protein